MTESIGQSLRRLEDRRFLTGNGRFLADIACPQALVLHMVRSPHAHARVDGIDATAARAMPGVVGVFTAADLAGLGAHSLLDAGCHGRPDAGAAALCPGR